MTEQELIIENLETELITGLVALPIALSTLILTINHYRSWKMWQLYLVLAINVWTNFNTLLYLELYKGERHWNFNKKSFGLWSIYFTTYFSFTLKPVATLIYALQNYQSVVRFLPYSKEHFLIPVFTYFVSIAIVIVYAFICAAAGYCEGFIFRFHVEKVVWWENAYSKTYDALFAM